MLTKSKNICAVELPARLASSRSNYEANCLNRREYFWGSPFSRSGKGRPPKMLTKSKNICAVELPARLASSESNYEANNLNH